MTELTNLTLIFTPTNEIPASFQGSDTKIYIKFPPELKKIENSTCKMISGLIP